MKPQLTVGKDFVYLDLPSTDKNNLGGHWVGGQWRFPNNVNALREINHFYPSPELQQLILKRNGSAILFRSLKAKEDVEGDPRLRPYQRVDVEIIKRLPHSLIGSEMRTGKTPVALLSVETPFNIVVVPASILINWRNEVNKWLPNSQIYIAKGTPTKRKNLYGELVLSSLYSHSNENTSNPFNSKTFLIISYETLKKDLPLLVEFLRPLKRNRLQLGTLIVDEAHRLNNHHSEVSEAVNKLGKLAGKRIAMTGTPSKDDGTEIFGILSFLYPDKFPAYWAFLERYWLTTEGYAETHKIAIRPRRQQELTEMLGFMSVNRRRKEVMPWLPKKEYQRIELEMSSKQIKAYNDVVNTFIYEEDGELKVDAPSILAQITRLRQIALCPALLDINAPSAKEEFLIDWLADNPNEQVIIFTGFTSYLSILAEKLRKLKYSFSMIVGDLSPNQKQASADAFQSGKSRILLANIQAGGVGFTLDNAETVIFLDKHYNPTLNDQAEDRMIPVSEDRNHSCTVLSLVCINSMDEKVERIIERKQDIIKIINEVGVKILNE